MEAGDGDGCERILENNFGIPRSNLLRNNKHNNYFKQDSPFAHSRGASRLELCEHRGFDETILRTGSAVGTNGHLELLCLSFTLIFTPVTSHFFCLLLVEISIYYNAFCGLILGLIPRLLEVGTVNAPSFDH